MLQEKEKEAHRLIGRSNRNREGSDNGLYDVLGEDQDADSMVVRQAFVMSATYEVLMKRKVCMYVCMCVCMYVRRLLCQRRMRCL
jgi:hypothetical protein